MSYRVTLASVLAAIWLYLLFQSGDSEQATQVFDRFNPAGLAAIAFIFAEPVARDRIRRHRRQRDLEEGNDDEE